MPLAYFDQLTRPGRWWQREVEVLSTSCGDGQKKGKKKKRLEF